MLLQALHTDCSEEEEDARGVRERREEERVGAPERRR